MSMDRDDRSGESRAADALDAYVARLLADRAGEIPPDLDQAELRAYLLASALAGARPAAAALPAEARARLDARFAEALAEWRGPSRDVTVPRFTRRQSLVTAAGLAAGVLVGVVADRGLAGLEQPPHKDLVVDGRWYDVAAASALPVGAVRRFSAGGIDGYLLNESGQVRAVSAICTHMGCHIDWHSGRDRFECLCHGAAFSRQGVVVAGGPWDPLPAIQVHARGGRIYVWGTRASSWGGQPI